MTLILTIFRLFETISILPMRLKAIQRQPGHTLHHAETVLLVIVSAPVAQGLQSLLTAEDGGTF